MPPLADRGPINMPAAPRYNSPCRRAPCGSALHVSRIATRHGRWKRLDETSGFRSVTCTRTIAVSESPLPAFNFPVTPTIHAEGGIERKIRGRSEDLPLRYRRRRPVFAEFSPAPYPRCSASIVSTVYVHVVHQSRLTRTRHAGRRATTSSPSWSSRARQAAR